MKKFKIKITFLITCISLCASSLSSFAMEQICDFHRGGYGSNQRCWKHNCPVEKQLQAKISTAIKAHDQEQAAYWRIPVEQYKDMTTPKVHTIPRYESSDYSPSTSYGSPFPQQSSSLDYYERLERQFISDNSIGKYWTQEQIDEAEISQPIRNYMNLKFLGNADPNEDFYDEDLFPGKK